MKSSKTDSPKRSPNMRPSSPCGSERAAANATIARLLDLIAEKDAQIRMVLEERFYQPLVPPPNRRIKSTVAMRPEEMNDVTQYPIDGDKEAVAKSDATAREAENDLARALDEEVMELAREQEAAHVGTPVIAPEPIEMLERVEPVTEPMNKAERSKQAGRQLAQVNP